MVENQEQLKDMGILEIFTQSFKTIFKCNKILAKIALTLILPLTTIFIANMDISNSVCHYHNANPYHMLFQTCTIYKSSYHAGYPDYFLLLRVFSIAVLYNYSTASVVYTITSIYTGDKVTYANSIEVLAKVWDRVTMCFISMLMHFVPSFMIKAYYDLTWDYTFPKLICLVIYIFGYLHMVILWQLVSTISVIEYCEWPKVLRTMILVMDKMRIAAYVISFTLYVYFVGVVFLYMALVVHGELLVLWRVLIGITCGVLLMFGFLFNMVIYTMLYLVYKSYKGEAIDSANFSYLADSQPDGKPQNQPAVSKV